jgi:hypothetical protein
MKSGGLLISRRERKQRGVISVIATLRLTDILFLARLPWVSVQGEPFSLAHARGRT